MRSSTSSPAATAWCTSPSSAGGKRINAVEDVLSLGQEIEVRVDEIDDKGKVSLSPAGDAPEAPADGGRAGRRSHGAADGNGGGDGDVVSVSFEEAFDAELAGELGDLGPASAAPAQRRHRRQPRWPRRRRPATVASRDRGRRRHR